MTNTQVILLIVLQAALASPGLWQFSRSLLKRFGRDPESSNLDAKTIAELARSANILIEPLNKRIDELQADITKQDKEIAGLKLDLAQSLKREGEYLVGIAQLTEQLVRADKDPVWRPPTRKAGSGPLGQG